MSLTKLPGEKERHGRAGTLPEERTGRGKMVESPEKCDICGKTAIGIQAFGCCAVKVCEDHADSRLKDLKPGEKQEWGACFFYRYGRKHENVRHD